MALAVVVVVVVVVVAVVVVVVVVDGFCCFLASVFDSLLSC